MWPTRDECRVCLLSEAPSARPPTDRTSDIRAQAIAALRGLRMTGTQIAEVLAMPLSTVSGMLTGIGLGTLSRLETAGAAESLERRRPGELIDIDVGHDGKHHVDCSGGDITAGAVRTSGMRARASTG